MDPDEKKAANSEKAVAAHTRRLKCRAAPASLSRCLLRLASECVYRRVDSLEHLNQYLRIPVESLHDTVHDLRHVVQIYIQVRLGQHADNTQLHLLDSDIYAGCQSHQVHRIGVERYVSANIRDRESDRVDRQLGNLENHIAVRSQ